MTVYLDNFVIIMVENW